MHLAFTLLHRAGTEHVNYFAVLESRLTESLSAKRQKGVDVMLVATPLSGILLFAHFFERK